MSSVENFIEFCESAFGTEVMDREAGYLKRHIELDDQILDVGCGIGSIEERIPEYEVTGLDRSAAMVRVAKRRVAVPFVVGDATMLPIRESSVDAAFFVATLEFIPGVEAALAEATHVLDTDGTLVALLLNTQSEYVQSNLRREGSYFQQMVHRDSDALAETILEYVSGEREFFLGISDGEVVERTDPETAAVLAVVGTPARDT
ncbi:class I SAM-dependent methyltransferase [Haloarcula nitratireducens]|uniref:Class I SAM-dependent methyltransferase n=1 Tax=Haloarcula nitratireducens TaxID=2487749 RepID=A0AAW4PJM1_9EURY|nr:class I SAM-dependent methyltransferase [Halomicroarcula nitratireducens]MBX0298337.1 class I SAM-dependent methyltransferase [Halomicroarcula nitratireducens]